MSRPDGISDFMYCDSASQNFGPGVNVHVSANVVLEWAGGDVEVIALTDYSPIERNKLVLSANSCSLSTPLQRVSVGIFVVELSSKTIQANKLICCNNCEVIVLFIK